MMRDRDTSAGFSLIELLVSLTIVALLMAMVPGTFSLGKRAWETGQSGNEREASAAVAFVEERLAGALPIFKSDSSGLQHLQFSGTQQTLSFLAELSSGPQGGGLYVITFGSGAPGRTELSLARYDAEGSGHAVAIETRDLSAGMSGIDLRYFGAAKTGEAAQWSSAWTRDDRLPDLVEVTPRLKTPPIRPPVVVELHMRPL